MNLIMGLAIDGGIDATVNLYVLNLKYCHEYKLMEVKNASN